MARHDATFEIDSPADARAVDRLLDRMHNVLREELRGVDDASAAEATLDEFEDLRDAASGRSPGTVTVVYEPRDGTFED